MSVKTTCEKCRIIDTEGVKLKINFENQESFSA